MSGYDIKKFTEKSMMSSFWNENYAWIYPTLKQLEQDGLVTSSSAKNAFIVLPPAPQNISVTVIMVAPPIKETADVFGIVHQ